MANLIQPMPLFLSRQSRPTQSTPLMGWQLTTNNIGLRALGINGASLPTYGGTQQPAAGTVISDMKITTTPMDCRNGNITIQRCLIQPSTHDDGIHLLEA